MAGVDPETRTDRMENLEKEFSQIKIHGMLLGASGAGKSSLVNSLTRLYSDYSPKRKYPYIPTARIQLMGGHTMMREPVVLNETMTVVDNRGWHDWGNKDALRELTAQIHGKSSYDKDVIWTDTAYTSDADKARSIPRVVSDKIDCIAIVINGNGGIGAIENLDKLIETCRRNTRRKPSFVITHRDKMSAKQIESITSSLEKDYDVDPEKIIVIKNVITRTEILDAESKSCLTAFMEAWVSDGETGADFHARRGTEFKLIETMRIEEKKKEISHGKLDLEIERQALEKIQLDIEKRKQERIAEISVRAKELQYEYDEDSIAIKKNHALTVNKIRLAQEASFHEHNKKCLTEYFGRKK